MEAMDVPDAPTVTTSERDTSTRAPAHARPSGRRLAFFAALVAIVIAIDQTTKSLIRGWLAEGETWPAGADLIRLTHVENEGAAFGILQGAGIFLVVTGIIAMFALIAFLFWTPRQGRLHVAALALVLGGAVGNFIDRVARGSVTDFINPTHYPSFNIADSAIVVGVCTLIFLSFFADEPEDDDEPSEAAA